MTEERNFKCSNFKDNSCKTLEHIQMFKSKTQIADYNLT